MRVSGIKLHNFRSYELYEATFSERGTVIVGPNGTGKTNLLEAVYVALRGSSFRGSLTDCMRHDHDQTTILLDMPAQTRRTQLLRDGQRISKTFTINSSTTVTVDGSSGSVSDIKTGDTVMIEANSSDSSVAASIRVGMGGAPTGQTQSADTTSSEV